MYPLRPYPHRCEETADEREREADHRDARLEERERRVDECEAGLDELARHAAGRREAPGACSIRY
jgi:hypothetical protein